MVGDTEKQTIWIVCHYSQEPPYNTMLRYHNWAKELIKHEFNVTIFAASVVHNTDINLCERGPYCISEKDGIQYVYIRTKNYSGNGIARAINMFQFYFGVKKAAVHFASPKLIIGCSPPPLAAVAAIRLKKKYGVPCINDIPDLWPQAVVEHAGVSAKNPVILLLYRLERWIYKNSDAVIFSVEGGADYIHDRGLEKIISHDKIFYINMGLDLESYDKNMRQFIQEDPELIDESKFKVVYCGSLRTANNVMLICESAKIIQDAGYDKIIFLIYGNGDQQNALEKYCAFNHLNNIKFFGRFRKEYLPSILAKSDLNLLNYNNVPMLRYGGSMSKMFEYFASGKPVLSNTRFGYDLVERYNCGKILSKSEPSEYVQTIINFCDMEASERETMGRRGRDAAEDFSQPILVDKLLWVFNYVDKSLYYNEKKAPGVDMPSLISVIIITYNQMNYIFETIDSVLGQDYPNIELIICDDCSATFDASKIESYISENKGTNITNVIIRQNETNLGTVKNINGGIKSASGQYIKIIAGDDSFYDGSVFSAQINALYNSDKLLITSKTQNCDEYLNPINNRQTDDTNAFLPTIFSNDSKTMLKLIRKHGLFPFVTQATCFKKEFFDIYGLFDEEFDLLEDAPLSAKIIRMQVPVAYCDIFSVRHRSDVGISANEDLFSKKRIRYYKDIIKNIELSMLPYPELYPPVIVKYDLKVAKFRYEMCLTDTQKEKNTLVRKNIDSIAYYCVSKPRESIKKIKSLLDVHKQ